METFRSEPLGAEGPELATQHDPYKDPEVLALVSVMRFAWGPSAAKDLEAYKELMARHGYSPEEARRIQTNLNSMRNRPGMIDEAG